MCTHVALTGPQTQPEGGAGETAARLACAGVTTGQGSWKLTKASGSIEVTRAPFGHSQHFIAKQPSCDIYGEIPEDFVPVTEGTRGLLIKRQEVNPKVGAL